MIFYIFLIRNGGKNWILIIPLPKLYLNAPQDKVKVFGVLLPLLLGPSCVCVCVCVVLRDNSRLTVLILSAVLYLVTAH